jgi:VWFA-related protein
MLRAVLAAVLVFAFLPVSDAPAQQQGAPKSPPVQSDGPQGLGPSPDQQNPPPEKKSDQDSVATFKSEVNVVNLYFSVKDHKGMLVPNLAREDFQVFDDGKPQTIKYFKAETDQPLTLGMLIDTSPSQTRVLPIEQQVGSSFLRHVLTKKDLAFVISFDSNVDLIADLTANPSDLNRSLFQTKIGGGGPPGLNPGPVPTSANVGGTHLYDAVYLASNEVLAPQVGRKAMILLTDGQDQGSKLKLLDAIAAAHKADAICYVILIADRGFYGQAGMGYSGDREMKKLAEETGGRVIDVGNNEKKLQAAFDQLAAELRSQYNIGYTPNNALRDGSFHHVQVKTVKDGYRVQARSGYYAASKP